MEAAIFYPSSQYIEEDNYISELFHNAALGIDTWHNAIQAMANATGSESAQLVGFTDNNLMAFNWVINAPEKALQQIIDIDGGNPLINPRLAASIPAKTLQVVGDYEYEFYKSRTINNDYADFVSTWDIPFGCQANLIRDKDKWVEVALLRTQKDGITTEEVRNRFAQIVPRVGSAVQLSLSLENQGALLVAGSFEAMSICAIICDYQGNICAITPRAEAYIQRNELLTIALNRLIAKQDYHNLLLQELINNGLYNKIGNSIILNSDYNVPIIINVRPLPKSQWGFNFLPSVIITISRAQATPDLLLIRQAFDLTIAEAKVAELIAIGHSIEEVSIKRNVSLITVRSQLKAIFAKMKISRQSELVSKILGLTNLEF